MTTSREEKVRAIIDIYRSHYRRLDILDITTYDNNPLDSHILELMLVAESLGMNGVKKEDLQSAESYMHLRAKCMKTIEDKLQAIETSYFEESEEI